MGWSEPTLKGRALKLLANRDHSRAELQRKLQPHVGPEDELQATLDWLEAKGFLSDQRVVQSVLNRRAPRLGAARVRQELQAKGLPDELVRSAVAELAGSETERAQQVWQRKFGQPPADPQARARQMRFLAARGFSAEAVGRVMRAMPATASGEASNRPDPEA